MSADKKYTRKEIEQHNTKQHAVFIIENSVYDVTAFLDDHPGGHEVLLNVAGKDASEDFDDVGHSLDAKELMKKYFIGELVEEDKVETRRQRVQWDDSSAQASGPGFFGSWKFPVLLGLLTTLLYSYLFG